MAYISVVVPVYGCSSSIYELYYRLKETLENINHDFEIILVNDASPDGAWEFIADLAKKDPRIKGINLSRNFGQHNATTAGLDYCSGDWIIVMDCDLQDPPEEILKLYNKAKEGYDIVYGRRKDRKDRFLKRLTSVLFYKIFSYLTDSRIDSSIANFCISNKKVIEQILKMREHHRSYLLFLKWVGFKGAEIEIEHSNRTSGQSGYSLKKLSKLAFDTIISFSDKPLRLTIKFGISLTVISLISILFIVLRNLIHGTYVLGWTSLISSIFFSLGIIVTILGIIGVYLGRVFEEVKNRPLYIIQEKTF